MTEENDQMTKKAKNHKTKEYCFEPNIRSNLHLVNFDVLTAYYIWIY